MDRHDPLLRLALRIAKLLAVHHRRPPQFLEQGLQDLIECQHIVEQKHRLMLRARERGLVMAARSLQAELPRHLYRLQERLSQMMRQLDWPAEVPPSPDLVLAELRQLDEEFEELDLRPRERVLAVTTDAITLRDVYLGPFRIELRIAELRRRHDSSCLVCIAEEPNSASSDDSVTHPHVKDKQLCAGEASVPIAQALRQGRISDAFRLVDAVLHTYNPHSPYVALESWEGVSCDDCGCSASSEDLCCCEGCNRDFCDQCISRCDVCEQSHCSSCLERDEASDRLCCESCRRTCSACHRTVDVDSFNKDTKLCPECQQERSEANEENEHGEEQQPEQQPEDDTMPVAGRIAAPLAAQ